MNYQNYCIGNEEQVYDLIIITGACRSGKTLFSRILGSMQGIEWIEEPYELILLLKSMQVNKDNSSAQKWKGQVFAGLCKELINDAVLLRNGNFRPNDLSTIWNYKESKEIFHRLVNINTREQVDDYVKRNRSRFLIDLPEVLNSTGFMKETYSNLNIIHVIRNPYDVAEAVFQKHWYSDQSIQHPHMNDLYRKYFYKNNNVYFIPWWVENGYEQDFINATEYERGIMYWIAQTDNTDCKNPDFLIKYEDMVRQPQKVLHTFFEWGFQPTGKTKTLCDELCCEYILEDKRKIALNQYYEKRFAKLKEEYGYE